VTGVGNKNTSQPSSRTNSPKSAEKAAWKRRKEYDPRRAVAEAKTKVKDKGNPTSALTSMKRMTRSASFTNTAELGGRYHKDKSVSLYSTDNVSIASVEGNDTFDDSSIASSHRGFIPYSGRSQSSHLYKNSDDEELGIVAKSSQVGISLICIIIFSEQLFYNIFHALLAFCVSFSRIISYIYLL
jgi:hypothetical protein